MSLGAEKRNGEMRRFWGNPIEMDQWFTWIKLRPHNRLQSKFLGKICLLAGSWYEGKDEWRWRAASGLILPREPHLNGCGALPLGSLGLDVGSEHHVIHLPQDLLSEVLQLLSLGSQRGHLL